MGKQHIPLKAVTYALSPYNQKVMPGLWKDLPGKIAHKFSDHWLGAVCIFGPVFGTMQFAEWYTEREKMHHRS
uniref:Ubiquinol-cytochrome c reductase n=1 Tax=Plantago major TaxID=29818 RepID=Q1EMP3_PLAMJ|nr:ubiquinol-cytochrome c reductase [Plantago major]